MSLVGCDQAPPHEDLADVPREFASDSDRILPGDGDLTLINKALPVPITVGTDNYITLFRGLKRADKRPVVPASRINNSNGSKRGRIHGISNGNNG